jgi:hypothetical protein
MYFTRFRVFVNSHLRFLELGIAGALCVPDASDFDTFVPVVVENMDHRLSTDDIYLPCATRDKFAVCGKIAWVDLRDFDVFFEDFHAVLAGNFFPVHAGVARLRVSGGCHNDGEFVGSCGECVTFELVGE